MNDAASARHPLTERLASVAGDFGVALARAAFDDGLAITRAGGGRDAIPIAATPVVLRDAEIRRRESDAQLVASAVLKMARHLLKGPESGALLAQLSPLERQVIDASWRGVRALATVRVDCLGVTPLRALEVNATIPAMQGYSDIAAATLIETVGARFGLALNACAALVHRNGSNARALFDALSAGYAARRGRGPESIAMLARRDDAQLTELAYLAARFRAYGVDAAIVHPDDVALDTALHANGRRWDLVYRHLFVRRLEQIDAPAVVALFSGRHDADVELFNPPATPVEIKTMFARVSEATRDAALGVAAGLTDAELDAARRGVPYTRVFRAGPSTGEAGERIDDLVHYVVDAPERFVLKRAWGYGGHGVSIGADAQTWPDGLAWDAVCRRAVSGGDGAFVVQRYVDAPRERHVLCTATGTRSIELIVDYSAFCSVGIAGPRHWRGVCRGSPSPIVNLMKGGGLVPLLTTDVADALLAAIGPVGVDRVDGAGIDSV